MSPTNRRRVGFSLARTGLIAGNTLREALRQRMLAFIVVLAVALVVAVQGLRELNFGSSELKFLADFGFGALGFFGAVLAIVATAQLFFAEIEHRTVLTLLAKPMRRSEFLIGKFAGVAAVLAACCVLMGLVIAGILWVREAELRREFPEAFARGHGLSFAAIAAAAAAQWLKLVLLAALTLLMASFARTAIFATATGFLLLVICQMQSYAQTAAERSGAAVTRLVAGGVGVMFPNFEIFDLADAVVADGGDAWARVARLAAYSAGYLLVVLAVAVASFRQREL